MIIDYLINILITRNIETYGVCLEIPTVKRPIYYADLVKDILKWLGSPQNPITTSYN